METRLWSAENCPDQCSTRLRASWQILRDPGWSVRDGIQADRGEDDGAPRGHLLSICEARSCQEQREPATAPVIRLPLLVSRLQSAHHQHRMTCKRKLAGVIDGILFHRHVCCERRGCHSEGDAGHAIVL